MAVTHDELLQRYLREVGREEPHFLRRSDGSLFVTQDHVLYYDRAGHGRMAWGYRRRNAGPARNLRLAMFVGKRYRGGCMLLNGDGFEDDAATDWQTRFRQLSQGEFGADRCPIVPYMALDAAQIDYSTVKVIEVTLETNDTRINGGYPDFWEELVPYDMRNEGNRNLVHYDHLHQHLTVDCKFTTGSAHRAQSIIYEGVHNGHRIQFCLARYDGHWYQQAWINLMAQPENGRRDWQRMERYADRAKVKYETGPFAGQFPFSYRWTEAIHRLGASVFSAHGPDRRRHRWVSAFDMNEPTPLYYLAQLPDRGVCKGYEDALSLLAPDIVHASRDQGRHVARQGDVFAIETNLTDETIYKDAVTRVRREVAFQDAPTIWAGRRPRLIPPAEGEVRERGVCPMCDCKPWVGNGEKAKRALMIHNTAHTADEVVVKKNGATFVRGSMYHDPHLEDASRTVADHQILRLSSGAGVEPATRPWYLAVRNTVPRQKAAPTIETLDAEETRQGHDGNIRIAENADRSRRRAAA